MRLLLDTSVLIDILRGSKARRELLANLVSDGHYLTTTALNIVEVYMGLRPGDEARIEPLLSSLECYPLDARTAKQARLLKNTWARKGRAISLPDAIVAAIAIDRGCILMSDNRKDFTMPEITLYPLPALNP